VGDVIQFPLVNQALTEINRRDVSGETEKEEEHEFMAKTLFEANVNIVSYLQDVGYDVASDPQFVGDLQLVLLMLDATLHRAHGENHALHRLMDKFHTKEISHKNITDKERNP